MKEIQLTKGMVALVDDEDYEKLSRYKWWYINIGYAVRSVWKQGKIYMHREITNAPKGMEVDHIDRNRLNNQKYNLRICEHRLNIVNRGLQSNNTSGYRGVHNPKGTLRWVAYIKLRGKRSDLGSFDTAEKAAHAYDKKAKEFFGEFARLNFPD